MGFNLMGDDDFTITYILSTIPNSPGGHKLPTKTNNNVWIIDIYGEESIKFQGALD